MRLRPESLGWASVLAAMFALGACGSGEGGAAPQAVEPAKSAVEPAPVADPAPVSPEAACRQAVLIQYGQADEAVAYDAAAGTVSWRAPVDGGALSFSCAVRGARVTLSRDGQTQIVTLPTSTAGTVEKEAR